MTRENQIFRISNCLRTEIVYNLKFFNGENGEPDILVPKQKK